MLIDTNQKDQGDQRIEVMDRARINQIAKEAKKIIKNWYDVDLEAKSYPKDHKKLIELLSEIENGTQVLQPTQQHPFLRMIGVHSAPKNIKPLLQ